MCVCVSHLNQINCHWKNATLSVSFRAFSMAADMDQAPRQTSMKNPTSGTLTLWLFNIVMEAMAHRNRWFFY